MTNRDRLQALVDASRKANSSTYPRPVDVPCDVATAGALAELLGTDSPLRKAIVARDLRATAAALKQINTASTS